jgi:hypothetical protein
MTRWTPLRLLVLPALFGLIVTGAPAAGATTLPHQVGPQSLGDAPGYVDTHSGGHTYSEVSGQWVLPAINCASSPTSDEALTIDLDGYTHSGDEQTVGTGAQCENGQAIYFSWYQMYPSGAVLVGTTMKAGDAVTASVTKTGAKTYALKLTDTTAAGSNFDVTTTCAATCPDTSAEWVSLVGIPAAFPPWKVTDATVTSGSVKGVISTFPHKRLGAPATGPLNAAGNGFKVS